jgi:hypothetical protein
MTRTDAFVGAVPEKWGGIIERIVIELYVDVGIPLQTLCGHLLKQESDQRRNTVLYTQM